jgi:hypothetical protein
MIDKLKGIFSNILSAAARVFWTARLWPPDLVAESAEIQRIRALSAADIDADSTLTLKEGAFWLCTDSMEITLNVGPAPAPLGFLKMLNILRLHMG